MLKLCLLLFLSSAVHSASMPQLKEDLVLGYKLFNRKEVTCREVCEGSESLNLCVLKCVHPECVSRVQGEGEALYTAVKECAVEQLSREFQEKLGNRKERRTRPDF